MIDQWAPAMNGARLGEAIRSVDLPARVMPMQKFTTR